MKDRSWPSEKRNGAISAEQRIKGSKTHQVKEFRLREEGKKKLRRRTGGTLLDRTDRVPFSPIKMAHFSTGPDRNELLTDWSRCREVVEHYEIN